MKQLRKISLLLLAAVLLVTLCSCGDKVKSEKINTKDYSRTIQIQQPVGTAEIVHGDKSTASGEDGLTLNSDDTVRVGSDSRLVLDVDGNKQVFAQENTSFRLEASGSPESGKTRVNLDEGGVLIGLDGPLAEGELFEVKTSGGTVSITGGISRVSIIRQGDQEYTLVEVLEGAELTEVVINATGEKLTLKPGEAALIHNNGKKPKFVLADEIDMDYWKSGETDGLEVGADGTGSAVLPIPYSKLPASVLEQLLEYARNDRTALISEQTISNLLETGHDYHETVAVEATCTESGKLLVECSLCGASEEREIPALGHTEAELAAVEPDCVNDGLTAGVGCSVCGEVFEEQEVIPALGHTEEELAAVEASCEAAGLTAGKKCSVCGEILEAQQEIPARGHQIQIVEGKDATLTEEGLTEGQYCPVCDTWVVEQQVIPAHEHSPVEVEGKAATCTEEGYTAGTRCDFCGMVLKECQPIAMLAHTPVALPAKAASCMESGLTEGSQCSVCGEILTEQQRIEKLDHTPETVSGREPTCSSIGLTDGTRCQVCGVVLEARQVIDKLPHTPQTVPGEEPTCGTPGLTEGQICSVCGKELVKQEQIPAEEHTPVKVLGLYPMCFRDGFTDGVKCAVCGFEIEPCEPIPALEHTPGRVSGREATCSSTGLTHGLACQICGCTIKEQEVIKKLPHTPGETVLEWNPWDPILNAEGDLDPAAEDDNYCCRYATYCTVCGELVEAENIDHKPGEEIRQALEEEGYSWLVTVRCTECKKIIHSHKE